MRSIRRAALVGATAASLVLGTVTVANAADTSTGTASTGTSASASATVSVSAGATTPSKAAEPKTETPAPKNNNSSALKADFKGLSSKKTDSKKSEPTTDTKDDKSFSSVVKGLYQKDKNGKRVTDPKAVSSRIGDYFDADQPANGDRIFGSSQDLSKEPKWARAFYAVTIASLVGSFLGLVVFPAYNFLLANNLIHR